MNKFSHSFQLRNEGEVGNSLGTRIEKAVPLSFSLHSQVEAGGMPSANGLNTPTMSKPIGADLGGPEFNEEMEYSSIVGILMNLAANTCPDIAYALHHAARFSHIPSTGKRYVYEPREVIKLSCYVDSDFGGFLDLKNLPILFQLNQELGFFINLVMHQSYLFQTFNLK